MASYIEGIFLRPLSHVGPLIGLYTPVIGVSVVLGVKLSLRQWSVVATFHNIKVRKLLLPPPPGSLTPYQDKTNTGLICNG